MPMILGKYTVVILFLVLMVIAALSFGCASQQHTMEDYYVLCNGTVHKYVGPSRVMGVQVECK